MWNDDNFRRDHSGENHYKYNGGKDEWYRRRWNERKMRGYYPLNPIIGNGKTVKGYERHHVNLNDIIYVPKDYNQDIDHNLKQGYNIEIVNALAYFFLIMNNIKDLNKIFLN